MATLIFDENEEVESAGWKQRMSANGDILKKNNVRHVLLVHGTFAGDDPLGRLNWLEQIEKNLLEPIEKKLMSGSTSIIDRLKNQQKSLLDHLAKDLGNYTPEYAEAFSKALDNEIICQRFIWSSRNNHLARLKGTVDLVQNLANLISENKILDSERILLLGHSHAGQLFALLTTFLENGEKAQLIYKIMDKSKQLCKIDELLSNLEKIKKTNLDIVTFGTPVRYSWGECKKYRLMAIVNHRSPVNIDGLLSTRDGDYVQQWGAEGTDVRPPEEIDLNDELDAILDKGRDISLLIESLKHTDRKHPHYANGKTVSETFLVNYMDNASSLLEHLDITHCVKTLFGHGVYTETKAMLFNTDIIIENLFKSPD